MKESKLKKVISEIKSEESKIRGNYSSYIEGSYGLTLYDVIHNRDLELKRKYPYSFWLYKKGVNVMLPLFFALFFLLQYVTDWILRPTDYLTGISLFFNVVAFLYVLYRIYSKISDNAGQKICMYEQFIKDVSKDEGKKRIEKDETLGELLDALEEKGG